MSRTYDNGRHLPQRHHRVVRPAMRAVADDLRAGQPVMLVGGRKLGKTVTLRWLEEALPGDEALPESVVVYHSLQSCGADDGMLFPEWCHAIRRVAEKTLHKAGLTLRAPPVPESWPADGARFLVFRRWLRGLIEAVDAEYGFLPLVLAVDEAERFLDFARPAEILGQLRALIEAEDTLTLVVAGYHDLYVYRDEDDRLSPLRNLCTTRRLGLLDADDCAALMAPFLEGLAPDARGEAARRLVAETGGHPYLVQSLCHVMQRDEISVEAVGSRGLEHAHRAFRDWVAPWSAETHALFGDALAAGSEGHAPPAHYTEPVQLLCYSGAARLVNGRLVAPVGRFNRWYRDARPSPPGVRDQRQSKR